MLCLALRRRAIGGRGASCCVADSGGKGRKEGEEDATARMSALQRRSLVYRH